MTDSSWTDIRQAVYERANGCCEYCQTCEINTGQTMQIDHIEGQRASVRATIDRLKMNRPAIVVARKRWADSGYHPPKLSE